MVPRLRARNEIGRLLLFSSNSKNVDISVFVDSSCYVNIY